MGKYYILDENNEPKAVDVTTWAKWFEVAEERFVQKDTIFDHRISTVFLGIIYGVDDEGRDQIFETMVFKPNSSEEIYVDRAATWDEAKKAHEKAKRWLINQTWKI